MKRLFLLTYLISILLLAACSSQKADPTVAPTETSNELSGVIVFGDVDADDPVKKIERLQPVAEYIAANLSEFGIGIGEVKVAPDIDTMAAWMTSGEVHVYYDSLFPALVVSDQSGAIPTLRRWKDGSPSYHALFFTRADSGIETLDDLVGKIIGYDDESSTSGYLLPTAYLLSNSFNPVEKTSENASVNVDEVGYIFTKDDDNTIEWVLSGRLDAGVVDNLTYMDKIPIETREQLVILAETDEVARQIVLMSSTLDPDVRDAVADLLVNLSDSSEGLKLLATMKTDQFDTFPEGAENAIETLRDYYNIVAGASEE